MFVMLDRQKIPLKKKAALTKNSLFNYFKKTASKDEEIEEDPNQKITEDYLTGRVSEVQ